MTAEPCIGRVYGLELDITEVAASRSLLYMSMVQHRNVRLCHAQQKLFSRKIITKCKCMLAIATKMHKYDQKWDLIQDKLLD